MRFIFMFILFFMSSISFAGDIISAIEVGSRGIKGVAVQIYGENEDGHYKTKIIYKREINSSVISGAYDGYLRSDRIEATAQAVSEIVNDLKKKDPQFIVIVGSTAFDKIENRAVLASAVQSVTNHEMKFVTSNEEMYYGILASVPKKKVNSAVLVDVGSGNTKIGFASPMAPNGFQSVTIPYGTVTLKEAARREGSVSALIDKEVIPALRNFVDNNPQAANTARRLYIVGGASWAAANLSQVTDMEQNYVFPSVSAIRVLGRQLTNNTFMPKRGVEKYNSEVNKVQEVFSRADLEAGINLLAAILTELNGDRRKIVFPRSGGWIFGYMYAQYNSVR